MTIYQHHQDGSAKDENGVKDLTPVQYCKHLGMEAEGSRKVGSQRMSAKENAIVETEG